MEKHKCKLCFKSFINGRALGGHIRSHKIEEPSDSLSQFTESPSSSSSSSSSSEEEEELEDQELLDPKFYLPSMVLHGRESETESSKNPTRRRSKRVRNWDIKIPHIQSPKGVSKSESEQVSSISDTTTDEDVAYCLMMLSRDKWKKKKKEKDETGFDFNFGRYNKLKKQSSKYKCETCERVFKSYQALGGHRASHKKIKTKQSEKVSSWVKEKIHECPVCLRVFASGQALGGHKRSCSLSGDIITDRQVGGKNMIDLNLPAPVDDDDVSAVSNW